MRQRVTMETLDDSGAIIATSTLLAEPKKGGIIWTRDQVRAAAGPVTNPARPKRTKAGLAERCTWKQQTVLLSALRGCDGRPKNDPSNPFKKKMRYTLLQDADSSTGFMKGELSLNVNTSREIREFFTGCMDSYPIHFFLHFLHAASL